MLITKKGVENILVSPSELDRAAPLLHSRLRQHFDACSKKMVDVVSFSIDSFDVVVNNAGSECVAKCFYTATVHAPTEGDVVCGISEIVDCYLVVSVSKHFKVFVKHPTSTDGGRVHVKLVRIKSQLSESIIALGDQMETSTPAILCQCLS